jgi:hypothetical protein
MYQYLKEFHSLASGPPPTPELCPTKAREPRFRISWLRPNSYFSSWIPPGAILPSPKPLQFLCLCHRDQAHPSGDPHPELNTISSVEAEAPSQIPSRRLPAFNRHFKSPGLGLPPVFFLEVHQIFQSPKFSKRALLESPAALSFAIAVGRSDCPKTSDWWGSV